MHKFSNKKSGFTIMEVLVSVGIMVVFLPFAASMLTNSQLLASYSKHKIQAAYWGQELIETYRQNISAYFIAPIGPIPLATPYVTQAFVTLDSQGVYPTATCLNGNLPCATETTTVTPTVYTSTTGVKTTSTTVDHFVVAIKWNENILKLKVPMTETYAADIANDTMLN